ncbi:flavin-containing monooxygenase [Pyrenochaeta sp. DS3sAY3a]|nr:flavin-containing monooxygenase [Pyrenochaeta sp. DS3sAY3a]
MASDRIPVRARTIAIVGAGPSGVIAAKYLRAEQAFDKIVLFEQRSKAGGIWTYTGDQNDEDLFTVPQTSPRGKNQDPKWKASSLSANHQAVNGTNGDSKTASFLSPMYEKLETNIPRGLMGFKDLDWPQDSQLFPKHETVLQYIEEYGKDVQDLVQYETQVINAETVGVETDSKWNVRTRNLRSNKKTEETFDAVIVANGHFIVPYVPDMPGLKEWSTKFPGAISHSKYYRRPEDFAGKKVVVIGNSASGADISNQVAQYCQHPLLWSSKSQSLFSKSHGIGDPRRRELPVITRFDPFTRGVEFADGTVEDNVDAIIFATGYFYSLPFLENVQPALITDGSHIHHTYQHLFYAPRPSLSFLALNQRVIPFPLAEAQASVLARVYSGRLSLPPLSEMQKWEQEAMEDLGEDRTFHLLPFPKDGNYINAMSQWALSAPSKEGLENEGRGKVPPVWGEWEFWCRENFPAIRRAFGQLGEKRFKVTSLEEVGFSFEEHKKEKEGTEGKLI